MLRIICTTCGESDDWVSNRDGSMQCLNCNHNQTYPTILQKLVRKDVIKNAVSNKQARGVWMGSSNNSHERCDGMVGVKPLRGLPKWSKQD